MEGWTNITFTQTSTYLSRYMQNNNLSWYECLKSWICNNENTYCIANSSIWIIRKHSYHLTRLRHLIISIISFNSLWNNVCCHKLINFLSTTKLLWILDIDHFNYFTIQDFMSLLVWCNNVKWTFITLHYKSYWIPKKHILHIPEEI